MTFTRRGFLLNAGLVTLSTACKGAPAAGASSVREVARTFTGMPTQDGAGVKLTRVIGQPALRNLDPFLMLDRFHSDDPDSYIRGFPDHPHRGFETVTVMLDGKMRHKDSRGNQGVIVGGGSQWMTAGRGIIHSEIPEQDRGMMSGFQLWVNLPAREKMRTQEYQDLQPAQLAQGNLSSGGAVRVIAGEAAGLKGPVRDRVTRPILLTAALEDDRAFELDVPAGHEAFVFVHAGELHIGPEHKATAVPANTLALLGAGKRIRMRAVSRRSGALIAAAQPIGEPIVQRGPFVMNTDAEIQKAYDDYRSGVLDRL